LSVETFLVDPAGRRLLVEPLFAEASERRFVSPDLVAACDRLPEKRKVAMAKRARISVHFGL
jgi:hypothetical protein